MLGAIAADPEVQRLVFPEEFVPQLRHAFPAVCDRIANKDHLGVLLRGDTFVDEKKSFMRASVARRRRDRGMGGRILWRPVSPDDEGRGACEEQSNRRWERDSLHEVPPPGSAHHTSAWRACLLAHSGRISH
jgi:hypothetical protein